MSKPLLHTKKLPLLTFYKKNWPVPYIVFAFRLPNKVVYDSQPERAVVLCRAPEIGKYLESDINGIPYPYIDFLPAGRTTPGTKCYTRIHRVRMEIGHLESINGQTPEDEVTEEVSQSGVKIRKKQKPITDWNMDHQPVILMERGIVFGVIDAHLSSEKLSLRILAEHPITLKGAYEST